MPKCEWRDTEDYWETECGEAFVIEADTPKENGMKFCPFCGGELVEVLEATTPERGPAHG